MEAVDGLECNVGVDREDMIIGLPRNAALAETGALMPLDSMAAE